MRIAFERYQKMTGDTRARLTIHSPGDRLGTRYAVINATTSLRVSVCGARDAYGLIHRYCDGWHDAMRSNTETCVRITDEVPQ